MNIQLSRREAALLGWVLRQVQQTAGQGATGQNLPDLLRIWCMGFQGEDPQLDRLAQRLVTLVKSWPPSFCAALLEERCRLRPLGSDQLGLELDPTNQPPARATA